MFNSFLDGSKPAIESAAIANACGLNVPEQGLSYPAGDVDDIPQLMRPVSEGGMLEQSGMVEVISSLREDGSHVGYDIRKGVWVCIEADSDYIKTVLKNIRLSQMNRAAIAPYINAGILSGLSLACRLPLWGSGMKQQAPRLHL